MNVGAALAEAEAFVVGQEAELSTAALRRACNWRAANPARYLKHDTKGKHS